MGNVSSGGLEPFSQVMPWGSLQNLLTSDWVRSKRQLSSLNLSSGFHVRKASWRCNLCNPRATRTGVSLFLVTSFLTKP